MADVQQNYVERNNIHLLLGDASGKLSEIENAKIRITIGTELEVCKGLESEDKCNLYLEDNRIMIYESGRMLQGTFRHSEEKVIQPYYFVEHVDRAKKSENDLVKAGVQSNGYQAIVDKAKIYRTPIFSSLNVSDKFNNSDSSIYLSGITNNMNDNNAIKEQNSVNDSVNDNGVKINFYLDKLKFATAATNPIYLYAKAKNTQNFYKVSFEKENEVTLYPNGSTRANLYSAEETKLDEENTADTEIATMLKNAEQHEIDINKVCAKLSYGQKMLVQHGKEAFLTKYKNANEAEARKKILDARIAKITKAMNYQQLLNSYVLIISTKEWNLIEKAGNERKPNSFIPSLFGISKGGRRKTNKNKKKYISTYKKRNKKSCKGKSKKQNKSRKVFFY